MIGWEAFPEEETHKLSLKGLVEFSQVKKDRRRAPQEGKEAWTEETEGHGL